MSLPVNRPEDVINLALTRIGFPERVNNMHDGTRHARAALLIYAQTRDAVLRAFDWGFAQKIAAAALSGVAAPAPWTIEYLYPADCLKLRDVFNAAYTADQNDPLPDLFTLGSAASGKVVWTNIGNATLVYTRQVTAPAQWEPDFVEALAAALGRRLAPQLAAPEATRLAAEDEKISTVIAEGVTG